MAAPEQRGHKYERNRAARRAEGATRFNPRSRIEPPSQAQLDFLRDLSVELGQRLTKPRTAYQASGQIQDLLVRKRHRRKPTS